MSKKKEIKHRDMKRKIPHRYIVEFVEHFDDKKHGKELEKLKGKVLKKFGAAAMGRFVIVELNDKQVEKLLDNPLVAGIEQDFESDPAPAVNEMDGWGKSVVSVRNFWNAGYTGKNVKVGLIDTGVNPHPDLPNLIGHWNVVNDTAEQKDYNTNGGHGTQSAGIIGAKSNGTGIRGVAYDCQMYSICCYYTGTDGRGYTSYGYTVEALQYATTIDVDVVLCNVQLDSGGSAMTSACAALESKGEVVLGAAGNYASEDGDVTKDTVKYPGHLETVISVGAVYQDITTQSMVRAGYSGTGPFLDVTAPTDQPSTSGDGVYNMSYGGTSCATPFATGVMALLKQAYPTFSPAQLRNKLYSGVINMNNQNEFGRGIINLGDILLPNPNSVSYPVISANTTEDFADSNFNFNITGDFILGIESGRTVLQSPVLTDFTSASSSFKFQVSSLAINPKLEIMYRVDSENADRFCVYVNGQLRLIKSGKNPGYSTFSLNLEAGKKYHIELLYYKDHSISTGLDGAFIDSISVTMSADQVLPGETFENPLTVSGTTASGTVRDTKDIFFKYTSPRAGSYVFSTTSDFDAYMELRNASNQLITSDDDGGGNSQPKITYTLAANEVVYLKVFGYNHQTGKYGPITLNVTAPAPSNPGDSFANAITVSGTSASGTLIDTKDLYFKYTAPRAGSYSFTTTSGFDAYMQVFDTNQTTLLGYDDDSAGGSQPKVTVTLTSGQMVYPKVYAYNHSAGKYGPVTLNITEPPSGSVPGAVSLTVGSPTTNSLTLTYSATGATSYDIYRNGSSIATGRTSTTYTDTGLSPNTKYTYYVVARNAYGSTTSSTKEGTTNSSTGPTPVTISEGFEGTKYAFTFTGDWADSRTEASTGTWSRKSKAITHKETSTMQFTENIPSNYAQTPTLKFDYFVSSEANYDYLEVLVNGVSKLKASGETGWVKDYTVTLGTGNQTVTFHYVKDGSTSKGQDCAYVDNIRVSY